MANQLETAIQITPNIKRQRYFQKYLLRYFSDANFKSLSKLQLQK